MKLYAIWQPLDCEDRRTALVFGFLRHAPVEAGLSAWLTQTLGRPTTAEPLEPRDFWREVVPLAVEVRGGGPGLMFRRARA